MPTIDANKADKPNTIGIILHKFNINIKYVRSFIIFIFHYNDGDFGVNDDAKISQTHKFTMIIGQNMHEDTNRTELKMRSLFIIAEALSRVIFG
jgi:hypothetical protein